MKRLKRSACFFLASLLLIMTPVRARAASATVAVSVATYSITKVLAAVGVLAGASGVAVLIGEWVNENEYEIKGAAGELGAYAQTVYDNARSEVTEISEKYQLIEDTLISLVTSAWGDVVTGVQLLADDLKLFMNALVGWGSVGS